MSKVRTTFQLSVSMILMLHVSVTNLLDSACAESSSSGSETAVHHNPHGYHHNFADAEKWTKKFDDPARDKWQKPDEVIKELKIGPTDAIVDIGAGTGYFSLRIAKAYPNATVYAADVEDNMIAFLKKRAEEKSLPNHKPLKFPPDKPDLPAKVNLVLIVDTYHHLGERTAYLAALKRQLLPNGRVAVIDFTDESPEGPPREHRIPQSEIKEEFQAAGYVLDRDVALLPYQYFLIFKPAEN